MANRRFMAVASLLVILAMVALTGCGGTPTPAPTTAPVPTKAPAAPTTAPAAPTTAPADADARSEPSAG